MLFVWSLVAIVILNFFLALYMVYMIRSVWGEVGCIHDVLHTLFPDEVLELLSEHEFGGIAIHNLESLVGDDNNSAVGVSEQKIKDWDEGE